MINEHKINISAHGYERLLMRTKCKRNKAESFLGSVWETGKPLEAYDKKSPMFRYLLNTIRVGGADRSLRVKGNNVFIFNKDGTVFITCFEITQKVIQDKGGHNDKIYFIHG